MTTPDYASLLLMPMTTMERTVIDALIKHGSQNAAADALGWKRTRVQSRLRSVQVRAKAAADVRPKEPKVHGRVSVPANMVPDNAPGATSARYILTAAQNNTPVHPGFLRNLEAYATAIGARIMVSRFSYNKAAYGAKSVKPGRDDRGSAQLWYDPAITPYVCDDPQRHGSCRWELAPGESGLLWCAEMNILPTAVRPLSGLDSYSGPASAVFPHAKIALESCPVVGDREPKLLYTTGAVTQRNYIAKKEGLKAEWHHAFGALLVEVDLCTGDWCARQINASDDGSFYDLRTFVADGECTFGHDVEGISWGDVHASEIDHNVAELNWGPDGVIDRLRPRHQFWHDSFSMRSRSHHEAKSFGKRYSKWVAGPDVDTVESEIQQTRDLLARAHRDFCTTVVIPSNHDEHLDRWLEEADYKDDLPNAELFLEAQLARVRATRAGRPWNALRWALVEHYEVDITAYCAGAVDSLEAVRFLARDESVRIGPTGHEVEIQHGDLGPDGARGNTNNLVRVPVRLVKGHSHVAAIRDGVYSGGVCSRKLPYARGPSSWSVSHVVIYSNGKRAILTMRGGRLWL